MIHAILAIVFFDKAILIVPFFCSKRVVSFYKEQTKITNIFFLNGNDFEKTFYKICAN